MRAYLLQFVPAWRLVQHDKSGLLVHVDDETGVHRHTVDLIKNSKLRDRIGTEAKRFIVEEYSLKAAVGILTSAYEKLID